MSIKYAAQNFVLWCVGVIAISIITLFILWKLANWLTFGIILLAIGGVVGTPLVMILRGRYRKMLKEQAEKYK